MELNAKKTKDMWITFKKSCPVPPPISIGPTEPEGVTEFKLLGLYVQNDLKGITKILCHFKTQKYLSENRNKKILSSFVINYRPSTIKLSISASGQLQSRPVWIET